MLLCLVYKKITRILIDGDKGVPLYLWAWCGLCVTDTRCDRPIQDTYPNLCLCLVVIFFLVYVFTIKFCGS